MAQFSLSWESHKQNICGGLSVLQQNGEFVDMTLAADGHHVKVHKMVMSLASPYIKDIVNNTQGLHPVLFLNKTSYRTLCALLEYIYTGEVMVTKENLSELIEAGKELHITGLKDMKVEVATYNQPLSQTMQVQLNEGQPLSERACFDNQSPSQTNKTSNQFKVSGNTIVVAEDSDHQSADNYLDIHDADDTDADMNNTTTTIISTKKPEKEKGLGTQIQYTISAMGALQMILNRFLYYHRYTSVKGPEGYRRWRCVNYGKKAGQAKCPAVVVTSKDVVIKRFGVHNHPFHDHKILKKVRDNAVFTAIAEAEKQGENMKKQRQKEGAT